jgi:hypothetical protein
MGYTCSCEAQRGDASLSLYHGVGRSTDPTKVKAICMMYLVSQGRPFYDVRGLNASVFSIMPGTASVLSLVLYDIAETDCCARLLSSGLPQEQQSQKLPISVRGQLWELAVAVWPQDSPDPIVRAQHYMAVTLVQIPNLTLPRAAISQLEILLGGAQRLGDNSWHDLLAHDPCFVLGDGPSGDTCPHGMRQPSAHNIPQSINVPS